MKIIIIIRGFPPKSLAGTELATEYISKYLAKMNHDVHVITEKWDDLPDFEIKYGFNIHRISNINIRFISSIWFSLKCAFHSKKIKPDIILIQSFENFLAGFVYKFFTKKPYVIWGRGSDVYNFWLFKNIILKWCLFDADGILALTENMRYELLKYYSRNISVIPNGIDLKEFSEKISNEKKIQLRKRVEEKIILYVGGLREVKGSRYLIEAFWIVRQKRSDVRLILIGEGVQRKLLEDKIVSLGLQDVIHLIGEQPHEDIPKYMINADIFVLPSLYEGFPNVLLEAMAAGLPIIATDVTGISEIITDGNNGYLVKPKDPSEIAKKIIYILENREILNYMTENNLNKIKKYSWEMVVEELSFFLRSCM